ncbi:ABC transporter ATP-binding protein [Tengunoibacter tsumagoiensis]|uniref:Dipeptide/oligopeptide/nickel ABC transporter ATP-binding protein n=1 Tax=Tengunoibacter tsumagoiensis TaxID=2014871 RepID=A0A402AA39_9CHLR|nr:ABC transporter ATP-binding protein [Tengunoibacter tsumagoiensis]GCE15989.1 dipeptide/oligopeptide/nickel ABC transporter ATP-binding protein [Tengunoibacter tsumagoiensis]
METKNDLLLEVKDVCVDYQAASGAVHAVDHVSFTLRRGEIMGLAGESGSGKSTVAYAIARLTRPPAVVTDGEIFYYPHARDHRSRGFLSRKQRAEEAAGAALDAVDILDLTNEQLRAFRWNELAIVFQSAMNALNPVMKVGDQILDVLKTHRPDLTKHARKEHAAELLKLVGIAPDRLNSYPHELSGGMRQRAVIAIALALNPELIIMDEPTTALDVVVQREILDLVKSLCRELGMAMIFITHDLSLLLELTDNIAIMYAGRLVETAAALDIYHHPRHPYSHGLLNSFPTLRGPRRKMVGIPGSPPDLRQVPPGCPFQQRCPMAFSACKTIRPTLRPASASAPGQLAACHLYDPHYRAEPPTAQDLTASYETLAERR